MKTPLEALLRELGRELVGESLSAREHSWRALLAADPEAAELAQKVAARRSEIPRTDAPPPEWLPGEHEELRRKLWTTAGDREALTAQLELWRRWTEHDPEVLRRVLARSRERHTDDVSYELFLSRLPEPAGDTRRPAHAG
jgi:hypothetical protein